MKYIYIVHGWGGSPREGIHKWLKSELEGKGFKVQILEMPNTENPKIEEWISFLREKAPNPDEDTYFIGHSIGCQAILRYLEILQDKEKIGGAVLIAPWVHLLDTVYEEPEEEKTIAKQWIETPINWEKCKSHTKNFVAIFSDNDFCVPLSDKEIFKKEIGAKIIVEYDKGYFTEENNVCSVPSAFRAIMEMSR